MACKAAPALSSRYSRSDFNGRNVRDVKDIASYRVSNVLNPGSANFFDIALSDGAGVEKKYRHVNGARG